MGILSFLARRSSDKIKGKPPAPTTTPVEALPSQSMVAREEFAQGVGDLTFADEAPVSTKDAATKAPVPRGRPKIRPIRLSPPVTRVAEFPAPAPVVRLLRDENALERPSTAPDANLPPAANIGSRLKKNSLRSGPPVSFRLQRPTTANPGSRPISVRGSTDPAIHGVQPGIGHSRSNSITNSTRSEGGRGFKDLLDAQSEIRPADFRSRVQASGARDYGEDVADRNIGENGTDLSASPVRKFYARLSKSHAQLEPVKTLSIAEIRTRSLTSSTANWTCPNKPVALRPLVPQIRVLDATMTEANSPFLRRRQSANMTMSGVSGMESDSSSVGASRGLEHSNDLVRPATSQAEKSSWDPLELSSMKLNSLVSLERPKTARSATADSSKLSCDQLSFGQQRAELPLRNYISHNSIETPTGNSSLPSPSCSHRAPVTSPARVSPRKRLSLQTLQPSASFDTNAMPYPRLRHPQATKKHSVISLPEVTTDFDVASSPTAPVGHARSYYIKSPNTIPEIREATEAELPPELFEGSTPGNSPELAPLKTRSVRGWSTSSATPTTSDASSKLSRHTANTSIDLSQGAPSIIKIPSHASLDSVTAFSPPSMPSNNFNIDDYISSDDDSFVESRRPRGEGEEQLLFSEKGYGIGGFQLPGIADEPPTTSHPPSRTILQHTRSSISLPPIYDSDSFGKASGRRYILDTAADSEDEDEDYTTPTITSPMRGPRGTKRMSAICSSPARRRAFSNEIIEEERTSKVDASAAVRLRKETKARKRASGLVARPRRTRSAMPLGVGHMVKQDDGDEADVE